ncbi:hypothetical protein [Streptomyces sp. NPDC010273]|uniref:hypothetical protein n=1 Tax=Streptomyces sp. NPDC010273 TaxID=3364829 RepID=UPI0036F0011B
MTTLDERHDGDARETEGAHRPAATAPLGQLTPEQGRFAGSKAANLARAARAGLPVLPGFVIPEGASEDTAGLRHACGGPLRLGRAAPRRTVLLAAGGHPTVVSGRAVHFRARCARVAGWPDFRTAVRTVHDSAHRPDGSVAPMAVLVQPMLRARVGGVLFGADPVEGRADRMLVSAVRGGPAGQR